MQALAAEQHSGSIVPVALGLRHLSPGFDREQYQPCRREKYRAPLWLRELSQPE